MTLRLRACGLSDVGRSRAVNEDSFVIDPVLGLFLVADGMGGHGHGDVASRLAAASIRTSLSQIRSKTPFDATALKRAVVSANEDLLAAVERDRKLTGMGTTLVALMVRGRRGAIAHIGDSRAYRLRGDQFHLLTADHTWVAEQVTAGNLSEDQARSHPFKSVVTRALGGEAVVNVELLELEPAPGDVYLLCSDGLTGLVADEQLHERLTAGRSLDRVCRGLVEAANSRGGTDNITALVIRVEEAA